MSLVMKVSKGAMIGSVLTTTIKAVLVGALVRVRQLVVEPIVRVITIVFIIVSKCGHHRYAQQYDGSHQKSFSYGHVHLRLLCEPNAATRWGHQLSVPEWRT
jgi:hypothetical protein